MIGLTITGGQCRPFMRLDEVVNVVMLLAVSVPGVITCLYPSEADRRVYQVSILSSCQRTG